MPLPARFAGAKCHGAAKLKIHPAFCTPSSIPCAAAAGPNNIKTMKIEKIAQGLVKLCQKGRFSEAREAYYSNKIVSVEPAGDDRIAKGLPAVNAKGEWWAENHTVHKLTVEGPFVGRKQFVVRFVCDVTFKPAKKRLLLDELAIYTVGRGKVVHEQFFYHVG